jgi:hypothetical protein
MMTANILGHSQRRHETTASTPKKKKETRYYL